MNFCGSRVLRKRCSFSQSRRRWLFHNENFAFEGSVGSWENLFRYTFRTIGLWLSSQDERLRGVDARPVRGLAVDQPVQDVEQQLRLFGCVIQTPDSKLPAYIASQLPQRLMRSVQTACVIVGLAVLVQVMVGS